MALAKRGFGYRLTRATVMGRASRIALYTDMHAFLSKGITMVEVFGDMIEIFRKNKKHSHAAVYTDMQKAIAAGDKLSVAMAPWIPEEEALMLGQGEAANRVLDILGSMKNMLTRQAEAMGVMVGAVMGGIGYIIIIVGMVLFASHVVVPPMLQSSTPKDLAAMSFAPYFFAFSDWFAKWFPVLGILVGGAIAWSIWSLPRMIGPRRLWLDNHLAPWSIYRRMRSTMFLISAATMLRAGVTMIDVLGDTARLGSGWTRWHARRGMAILNSGGDGTQALSTGLLPRDTADRLKIYKRLVDLDKIMPALAEDNFIIYKKTLGRFGGVVAMLSRIALALYLLAMLGAIFDFAMTLQRIGMSGGG